MATVDITDAEAQEIMDKWLAIDTQMGEWRKDHNDWVAYDCETKIGPLAGLPISLRVAQVRRMFVGEARRMGIDPRGYGPGEALAITLVAGNQPSGWPSAGEAMAGLAAVLHNRHDPDTVRLHGIDRWEHA